MNYEYRSVLSLADKAQATLLTRYQTLSGLHSHHSLQLLTPSYSQMQIHILEVPSNIGSRGASSQLSRLDPNRIVSKMDKKTF